MSSSKKSVPRVASFPGPAAVARKKKPGSSPHKDVDKFVGTSHKSLPKDYRMAVPGLPKNLLSSPPGVTYMLSDDSSGTSPSQSQTLSGLGSTPGSSKVPRKSKLMLRSARGQCLAALQKQSSSNKAMEMRHVEENTTLKGSDETSDIWNWEICHKKPTAKSSQGRVYYQCAVKGCPAKKMVKPSNNGHPSFMKPVYFGSHTCATTSVGNPERDNISPECAEVTSMETSNPPQPFRFKAQASEEDKNPKRCNSKVYGISSSRKKSDPRRFDCSELEGLSDSDNPSEIAGKAELDTDMISDEAPGIGTQEWSEYPEHDTTSSYENISRSQFTEEWSFSQDMLVRDDYIQTNRKFEDFKVSSTLGDRSQSQVDGFPFNEFLLVDQAAQEAEDEDQPKLAVDKVGNQGIVADSTKQGLSSSVNVSFGNNNSALEPTRTDGDNWDLGRDIAQKLKHLQNLQVSGDVVVAAGQVVGQSSELYFLDAKSMSRIVGVGLPYSKTLIQNESAAGIEVFECSEREWMQAWTKALDAESSFTILTTRLLDCESEKRFGPVSMSGTEMAENFGVGMIDVNVTVQYSKEVAVGEQDSPFRTKPLLSEVVKYLLSMTRVVTKDVEEGSSQMGSPEKEVLTNESRDVRMKELQSLLCVTIHPSHEGTISLEEFGALLPSSTLSGAPKIISSLTMDFAAKFDSLNRIAVEVSVDCALEDPRQMRTGMHLEPHGWYHDNINVSLKCVELDKAFLMDPYGLIEIGDDVDPFGDTPNCSRMLVDEAMMGKKMSAGFFSRDLSSMGDARLAYEFSKFSDNDDCNGGVGVPLRAITRGTWELATEAEKVPYLFKMERQLFRRTSLEDPNDSANGMTSQELYQDYEVLFYVNHAMTHLQQVGNLNKIMVGTINDLMR